LLVQETAKPATTKLALPQELLQDVPLLVASDAIKSIAASLMTEAVPAPRDQRSAEAVMAKRLGDKGPTARAAKMVELEANIARLQTSLTTLEAGGDALESAAEPVRQQLAAAKASLQTMAKDAPTQTCEHKAIQEARASLERQILERKEREQKGAAKAQQRQDDRMKTIADLKAQVALLEAGMNKMVTENAGLHSKRAEAAQALDQEVLKLFDDKLAALATAAAQPMGTNGPVTAAPGPAGASQPPGGLPPASAVVPANALALPATVIPDPSNLAELAEAKNRIKELTQKVEELSGQVVKAFQSSYQVTMADVPTQQAPPREHREAYAALRSTLEVWAVSGASEPFDWQAMRAITPDGPDPATVARSLLGEELWKKWYTTAPEPALVVPKQMALLILHCLNDVKAEIESDISRPEAAKRSEAGISAMKEGGKRLKMR